MLVCIDISFMSLNFIMQLVDSDVIAGVKSQSLLLILFFAITNHLYFCHCLMEALCICIHACINLLQSRSDDFLCVICLRKYCDSCSQDILRFTVKFICLSSVELLPTTHLDLCNVVCAS